jgi:hypothetical protein
MEGMKGEPGQAIYGHETPRTTSWVGWGRIRGLYDKQCGAFPKDPNGWSFCHSRAFRVHLVKYIQEADFKMPTTMCRKPNRCVIKLDAVNSRGWLQKVTDRVWLLRFLQLAGPERSVYVPGALVYYRTPGGKSATVSDVTVQAKAKVMKYIKGLPKTKKKQHINIIMCIDEPEQLGTLDRVIKESLLSQTEGHGSRLHLHVCDNLPEHRHQEQLMQVLNKLELQPRELTVEVWNFGVTIGAFAKFLIADALYQTGRADFVILMNADLVLKRKGVLGDLWGQRQPQSMICQFGQARADYHVCGTSYAVIDASFVRISRLFTALPLEWQSMPALWLSFVLHSATGWSSAQARQVGVYSQAAACARIRDGQEIQWVEEPPGETEIEAGRVLQTQCGGWKGW